MTQTSSVPSSQPTESTSPSEPKGSTEKSSSGSSSPTSETQTRKSPSKPRANSGSTSKTRSNSAAKSPKSKSKAQTPTGTEQASPKTDSEAASPPETSADSERPTFLVKYQGMLKELARKDPVWWAQTAGTNLFNALHLQIDDFGGMQDLGISLWATWESYSKEVKEDTVRKAALCDTLQGRHRDDIVLHRVPVIVFLNMTVL